MGRIILVHVNVEVPDDDARTTSDVVAAMKQAIEVGSDQRYQGMQGSLHGLTIEITLAEEV